jgi:hypothetical protein
MGEHKMQELYGVLILAMETIGSDSYYRLWTDRIHCRSRLKYAIQELRKWGVKVTSTELQDD